MGIVIMKRLPVFFLLFILLFSIPKNAEAQFWKNWFKKKDREEKYHKPEHKQPTVVPKPGPLKKKIDLQYPPTKKKSSYRVDVLVPLYIDDLAKSEKKFPDKSLAGIEFYEGIKLATDTLNSFHYKIEVYVHDISAPATNVEALIRNHTLDSSDLIIGAVQSHDVTIIAQYAKKRQVNFISALSPSDGGIKDNPYFILPQPTLQVHCNYLMTYIQKKLPKKKLILFYRTNIPAEQNAYTYITNNDEPASFKKVLCNTLPDKIQLKTMFDSTQENVVIMTILDNAYAETMLRQLHDWFPNYHFEVYGMPSWKTLPGLKKPEAYPNVAVYFTSPFYFDQSRPATQGIEKTFRREYGGKPAELVYRAYETMYWYAYLLNQYGTIFNNKFNDNSATLFTKYEIQPKFDKDLNFLYNENQHLYLYKYQSSSFIVEQ